jgi:hypothetical protein
MKICIYASILIFSFIALITKTNSQELSIKAYLVYDGGKESKTDLFTSEFAPNINNVSLMNADLGGLNLDNYAYDSPGSKKIKLVIAGHPNNVDIIVKKGAKVDTQKKNISLSKPYIMYINNVKCNTLYIQVKENTTILLQKEIELICGE